MPKFAQLSLDTLKTRLGAQYGSGISRGSRLDEHRFRLIWNCKCIAVAQASDKPMPPGLSAWQQEIFEHAPLPEMNWTLAPCAQHRSAFSDHPEEPD